MPQAFSAQPQAAAAAGLQLPRYQQLPALRLYLDQLIEAVTTALEPLLGPQDPKWLSGAMVGNYIKQGVVPRPEGKRYRREHVAYLLFVCIAKQVLSMEEIRQLIALQNETYPIERAYDYFCNELEQLLAAVFAGRTPPPSLAEQASEEARVLRAVALAVAHKAYLEQYLVYVQQRKAQKSL